MNDADREAVYGRNEYYWGTEPNELARRTLEEFSGAETQSAVSDTQWGSETPTVIDIGAGEGRDAVFFAENGWTVYAMDVSPNGLAKAERLAERRSVTIETVEADANDARLPEMVDAVYSAGTVQYIRPENRERQFRRFQADTKPGGLHVIFAFVDHPDVPTPPDWTDNEYFYEPGELAGYYEEWDVLEVESVIFDDESGGEPHQHAAEILFARNRP
ncbi:methyltransferase domain-containing protein [Natronorubrum daqingense]|uniref:Tellurite resistance protein TehB n=1 Tax=Natronorubrum daqingense TaxID=588898 RepID=A0A1N6ZEW2_9EURY|nr:methyltransferase domain-containing protein [Natronorubrum daqingense]APX98094.1 XRE family transcriptional regulator [Natronorubrum daqingense]SIR25353.1 Tellurite resistance protein TehB [Natronorubrum daqingense]